MIWHQTGQDFEAAEEHQTHKTNRNYSPSPSENSTMISSFPICGFRDQRRNFTTTKGKFKEMVETLNDKGRKTEAAPKLKPPLAPLEFPKHFSNPHPFPPSYPTSQPRPSLPSKAAHKSRRKSFVLVTAQRPRGLCGSLGIRKSGLQIEQRARLFQSCLDERERHVRVCFETAFSKSRALTTKGRRLVRGPLTFFVVFSAVKARHPVIIHGAPSRIFFALIQIFSNSHRVILGNN